MEQDRNPTVKDCAAFISLTNAFRRLWEQHVMWTRSFIISSAAGLEDLQLVTQRLLRNPADFAYELQRFYGIKNADAFRKLLTEHLQIAAKLVNEAKRGNTAGVEQTRLKWVQNADEIAAFLAGINPFWSKKAWQAMFRSHLKITEEEAVLRLRKQYASDIAIYDDIEAQALEMADTMVTGILRQFRL